MANEHDGDTDQGQDSERWRRISQPLSRVIGDGIEAPSEADLEGAERDDRDAGRWLP